MESETPVVRGLSARFWLSLLIGVEILIGISYIGIYYLQISLNVFAEILQILIRLIYDASFGIAVALALTSAGERRVGRGCARLALFLLSVVVRDLIGNTVSWYHRGYGFGDAALLSLTDTAVNSLLTEAIILITVYLLALVIFFTPLGATPLPERRFDFTESRFLRAVFFVAAAVAVRRLGFFLYDTISFCIDVFWMLRISEIFTILRDFLLVFVSGGVTYFVTCLSVMTFPRKNGQNP